MGVDAREKAIYFARLAEQAERYDEMAEHMQNVGVAPEKLSDEERRLLSVAYSNTVARRKAARRSISSIEQEENLQGNKTQARFAREYCAKVEGELDTICTATDDLLHRKLSRATTHEETVFYQKMKADNLRQVAELVSEEAKVVATESAQKIYAQASTIALESLPETHPVRFGLALNYSVFQSEVLGKPEDACRTAPTSLRNASSWAAVGGGVSPRTRDAKPYPVSQQPAASDSVESAQPLAVVAQRLCDLLLEFPEAAIGGLRWRTLMRTYTELYQTDVDIARLGYMSPSAAAKGLLADVLRTRADGLSHCDREELDNPLVAIDDTVAMTPLPGFAGSWPALYRTLCMMVQRFGNLADLPGELDAAGVAAEPAHILLLSQLRPLLEKSQEDDSPGTAAGPVRGLLLSQLRPVSQLWHASSTDNGLSFRDEEGNLRKLQKMGHLVKAVLRWRDQRVKWRHAKCGGKSSSVDQVLSPRLELVFSKEYNNLVLCLIDKDAYDASKHAESLQETKAGAPAAEYERPSNKPNNQRFENPFKWPVLHGPASAGRAIARSGSTPCRLRVSKVVHCQPIAEQPTEEVCAAEQPAAERAALGQPSAEQPAAAQTDAAQHVPKQLDVEQPVTEQPAARLAAAQTVSEQPAAKQATSEQPAAEQCAVEWGTTEKSEMVKSQESQHFQPTAEKLEAMALANQLKESPRCSGRWGRKPSPLGLEGLKARSPSAGVRAPSCQEPGCRGRSRSLAREGAQVDNASQAAQVDHAERSTSEPPRPRWADIYDEPFESSAPHMLWTSFVPLDEMSTVAANSINFGGASSCGSECWSPASYASLGLAATGDCASNVSSDATTQLLARAVAIVNAEGKLEDGDRRQQKRLASPMQFDRSNADAERVAGSGVRALSCTGRARSLTRVRCNTFRQDTTNPFDQTETAELRSTSEPPQRWMDVFDDPFEPPPQEVHWAPPRFSLADMKPLSSAPQISWNCAVEPSGNVSMPVVPLVICSPSVDIANQDSSHNWVGERGPSKQKRWTSPGQRISERVSRAARQSPSGARSGNAGGRARSLTRAPSLENIEQRSTSEPPHVALDDVFDDPFEPPPQQMWASCMTHGLPNTAVDFALPSFPKHCQ